MTTAHRETTITVYGVTRTIRTEQTGTTRQLEAAHTKAVKAALEELHAAGKGAALASARAAAEAAGAKSRNHHSGLFLIEAQRLRDRVARIEKRKFTAPAGGRYPAMRRPFPPVKCDIDVTDPRVADYHEAITPGAPAHPDTASAEAAVEEPAPIAPLSEVGMSAWLEQFFSLPPQD